MKGEEEMNLITVIQEVTRIINEAGFDPPLAAEPLTTSQHKILRALQDWERMRKEAVKHGGNLSDLDILDYRNRRRLAWNTLFSTKGPLGVMEWGNLAQELDDILDGIIGTRGEDE